MRWRGLREAIATRKQQHCGKQVGRDSSGGQQ
jgi:hypothetical protein